MARIYKETTVDVRPRAPSTIVDIQIPTQESFTQQRRPRFSLSSVHVSEIPTVKDEEDFAKRFLATQGAVYFRRRKSYPRAFLWRVVEDGKVLEIHPADLVTPSHEQNEANVTLRLDFQEAIIPSGGVALADREDHEVLNVFVLTASSRRLYTMALRPAFFQRPSSIDDNVLDWCKSCTPSPLNFAYPHRLHASSTTELFISLDSGALLRLTRRAGDDGSHWSQILFDEKPWGASLRGLMKWNTQQPLRYDGRAIDPNTPNAIATSSDQSYVFAVCLNHTLKVWNLASNKLVGSTDLLGRQVQSQRQQDSVSYYLNPSDTAFIRVFNAERALDGSHRYYVATYSPHEDGRFKFWAIKGGLTTQLTIEDLFPQAVFRPRDPDASGNVFWSVADFQIRPAEEGKRMELWILWRNNNMYQLYSLHFDFQSLEKDWLTNWTSVALDSRRYTPPPVFVASDVVDPTEKWLEYLFLPGRYSVETLETALVTFQEALKPQGSVVSLPKRNTSLQERLCSAIAGSVSLRKYTDSDLDYAKYRSDTDLKWRHFWQIADDLNTRRLEPLSLSYDSYTDLPWVVLADSCSVIRECSPLELLLHNSEGELSDDATIIMDRWRHRNLGSELGNHFHEAAHLIKVASGFTKRLPAEAHRLFRESLDAEICLEPSLSAPERLAAFQERSELGEHVSDELFDGLCTAMNEEQLDVYNMPKEVIQTVLDKLPLWQAARDSELSSTWFGLKVAVNGCQETIQHTREILYNLLVLVVFISGEVSQEEGSTFDGVELFATLIDVIKEYEVLYWLSKTTRMTPTREQQETADRREIRPRTAGPVSTILEDMFAVTIKPRPTVGISQSYVLTRVIRDILAWITRQGEVSLPNVLVFIQCDLIANGNIDLASEFLRIQPSTAWSTYVKGRLYVARSDFDTAALYFQKAAHGLSSGRPIGNLHEMSSNLLDIMSVDKFNNGLPKYFQHVVGVFEQARAYTQVGHFASLALQALETERLQQRQQGASDDAEYHDLRTDLLSRLFYASIKTCQFEQAFSALARFQNPALQKSALNTLLTTIIGACGPGTAGLRQLLRLLPLSLSPELSAYVDEALLAMAKNQTSFSSAFDDEQQWWDVDSNTPDYHRILHAYRIARNDFRGAAELGYQTVQRLRRARDAPAPTTAMTTKQTTTTSSAAVVDEDDRESKEIRHELLTLINLLACVDEREAYILVDVDEPSHPQQQQRRGSSGADPPRKQRKAIVTLDHLRREYQAELDRVSRIERGDWEFGILLNGSTGGRGHGDDGNDSDDYDDSDGMDVDASGDQTVVLNI